MTDYQYTSIEFAGIPLDTFVTSDGRKWVTLSSMANGLGQSRQNAIDWLRRKQLQAGETLEVKLGKRQNVKANAYPVAIVAEYLTYLADRGVASAKALLQATFQADLERAIAEANGIQVSAAQHEENRAEIRYQLCTEWGIKYEQGDRDSFYQNATEEEVKLVHAAVHLNRLMAAKYPAKLTKYQKEGWLLPVDQRALDSLRARPEVVKLAEEIR